MSAIAHEGDTEIFYRGSERLARLNPLLLIGAPRKALLSRSPQRNTASPLARVEDGKVTSAKVKQPGRVTPDILSTHPRKTLLSRSPHKDYSLALARVEDGKGAGVFHGPSHGRSPPSPLW